MMHRRRAQRHLISEAVSYRRAGIRRLSEAVFAFPGSSIERRN